MTKTPIIDKFAAIMNAADENSKADMDRLQEVLRRRPDNPFDFNKLSPGLAREIQRGADGFNMSDQAIFNTMLCALSLATGRYTEIYSPQIDAFVKPCLYVVNIAQSGSGKTPAAKWVFNPTVEKRNDMFVQQHDKEADEVFQNEELGPQESQRLERKVHLSKRICKINDYNTASLTQGLRNGALMAYFDELTTFWKINRPKNQDPIMNLLTSVFSDYKITVSRITPGARDVHDGALSLYAHGTNAQLFFENDYLMDGTTYRFLFTNTDPVTPEHHVEGGFDARMANKRQQPGKPAVFEKIFDKVFDSLYLKEGAEKTRNRFYYSPEAQLAKERVSRGILDGYSAFYIRNNDPVRQIMISKMHGFIDKLSLLFHLIRLNDPEQDSRGIFNMSAEYQVDEECVDMAFDYFRCMFNNWLDLYVTTSADKDADLVRERSQLKEAKSKPVSKILNEFVVLIGGHGEYTVEQVEEAVEKMSFKTRVEKSRLVSKYLSRAWNQQKMMYIL